MAVVRYRGTNAFQTERRVEKNSPPVRMQITCCDPEDRTVRECVWLAIRSCQIAFRATDVARGRLDPKVLKRFMVGPIIEQIRNLLFLLKTEERKGVDAQIYEKNLPIRINGLHATVLHPECFDACISLTIGKEPHTVNVVLSFIGSRWMCTYIQLG